MNIRTTVIGVVLFAVGMIADVGAQIPGSKTQPNDAETTEQPTAPAVDINSEKLADPATAQPADQAPSQTPSATAEPIATLSPGLYQSEESAVEFNEEDDGFNGAGSFKLQLDLKTDGAFTLSGYVSAANAGLSDQAIFRIRGLWQQQGETLIASDMLEQFYDFETTSFSPWESPEDGQVTETINIRNVAPNTFQEYDEDSGSWMTWKKL